LQNFSKCIQIVVKRLGNKALYEFEKFRFDPENHLLSRDGVPASLTPKAFEILLILVQNGSRLTTKEELMSKVWPDSFVEEANLTVNISALRKVLGEADDFRQYIETVPKKGYRFIARVRLVENLQSLDAPARETLAVDSVSEHEQESDRAERAITDPTQTIPKRKIWSRFAITGLSLFLVFVVAAGYVAFRARGVLKRSPGQPRTLAVLPFQNLRENAESEFLGFSLADAVITKLGYVSQLAVRPSYAVQKYRTQPVDIRKVAGDLNADTLLTGTFLREGDDLRIACQLIDVKSENILWKGTFDLKYDKLLTVQDNVAQQIIKGLELTLSPSEAARLRADESISPVAYEYYLRGIDLYSTSDFPMAIKMLEKSTELAPNYALAWANLGKTYTANASFRFGGGEQYRKAQAAFERSLALEPDQIDARIYIANMFTDTGRVEKAVPLLREGLKSNPNHAEIHWELGYAYRFAGMLNESVAECERARQLDPGVKLSSSTLNAYLYLGQYDKFLESLPKTDDSALIAFYRGFAEYYKKDSQQAARDFDHALELDRSLFHAQLGKALSLGIGHQVPQGLRALRTVEAKINQFDVGDPEASYKIAQAYAVLGDKPAALRVFKRSIGMGFFPHPYFFTDPLLDSLRKDSEFQHLMNEARLRHEAFAKSFF
jgi:DNA-binding winged helix-turn-helix (wHTH) protein/TolB-like protein